MRRAPQVIAGEGYALAPRCTVDRTCYCTQDVHCPADYSYDAAGGRVTATFKCVRAVSVPGYTFGVCRPEKKA
jgi:hypothetical protein